MVFHPSGEEFLSTAFGRSFCLLDPSLEGRHLNIMRPLYRLTLPCLIAMAISGAALLHAQTSWDATSQTKGDEQLTERERMLLEKIANLEKRVEVLESRLADATPATSSADLPQTSAPPSQPATNVATPQEKTPQEKASLSSPHLSMPSFFGGTTLNLNIDAYYGYNFNDPIGRVNLLRAYDVSSNAISLNQAGLILDNQADPDKGKRWGFRFDLQFGQATETLQGNPANEPRPDIYRNIFQAYGTYVLPIGRGLSIDFGKFASSLGYEGNYTKDQMNYSRSFWFDFLPFYHMGARVNYKLNDKLAFNYWLVNGTQQTEPFNGYKDEFFGLSITPNKNISWNVNYYLGQEHPDVEYFLNGGAPPNAPTLQGTPFLPILNPPHGKLHIFDTYVNWQTTPKFALALEADDEVSRLYESSPPAHTIGGAAYAQYQLAPKLSFAARGEYLSDRGGLFTGVTQAIKETTFTTKYAVADGFTLFGEWRRDFSNRPYFYTSTLGILKTDQNTATLGLVWWWGGKEGNW